MQDIYIITNETTNHISSVFTSLDAAKKQVKESYTEYDVTEFHSRDTDDGAIIIIRYEEPKIALAKNDETGMTVVTMCYRIIKRQLCTG